VALSIVTQNNDDGLMHGLPEDFGWRTHDRGNTPPARNGTMIRMGRLGKSDWAMAGTAATRPAASSREVNFMSVVSGIG